MVASIDSVCNIRNTYESKQGR